ncbi:hypothetical protein V9L00_07430 [Pseudoxanthomonas sp. CCNWLW206]
MKGFPRAIAAGLDGLSAARFFDAYGTAKPTIPVGKREAAA